MKLVHLLLPFMASTLATNITTVYQFPNNTWLENIAFTHNGSLLVTLIGVPEVYIVHPPTGTTNLVTSFPNATAVMGITEVAHDVFAVAVGTITLPNTIVPGSFSIYTVDLSPHHHEHEVKVEKIVDLKNMQMVNGVTVLNSETLLLADSYGGNIFKVNLKTRNYGLVLQDESLEANDPSAVLPAGVNGIRFHSPYLYYTNTVQNLVGRVKLNAHTGEATGTFEAIASGAEISQPDDFAILRDGSILLARPLADTLQVVGLDGKIELVGMIGGVTSVVLAKGERKGRKNIAYVCTSGLEGGVARGGGRVRKVEF